MSHEVATAYGTWKVSQGGGTPLHGAFIVDRGGIVRWVHVDERRFTDVDALLAALENAK